MRWVLTLVAVVGLTPLAGCDRPPVGGVAARAGLIGPLMDLRRADLSGHDLADRDLNGIRLDRAVLDGTDLQNANLERASLRWVDLRTTKLGGANLRDADLRGATFPSHPGELTLAGADLRGVDLEGSDLRSCDLDGADLRGARANEDTQWPPDFGNPWAVGVKGLESRRGGPAP